MPNSEWYKKNRTDILSVSVSLYSIMLNNDGLLHLDHEEIARSAVDYATILVAEIDQRGIGHSTVPSCAHHVGMKLDHT